MAADTNQKKKGEKSGTASSAWGQNLATVIYIVTMLCVFGYFWQSIAPYFFTE